MLTHSCFQREVPYLKAESPPHFFAALSAFPRWRHLVRSCRLCQCSVWPLKKDTNAFNSTTIVKEACLLNVSLISSRSWQPPQPNSLLQPRKSYRPQRRPRPYSIKFYSNSSLTRDNYFFTTSYNLMYRYTYFMTIDYNVIIIIIKIIWSIYWGCIVIRWTRDEGKTLTYPIMVLISRLIEATPLTGGGKSTL